MWCHHLPQTGQPPETPIGPPPETGVPVEPLQFGSCPIPLRSTKGRLLILPGTMQVGPVQIKGEQPVTSRDVNDLHYWLFYQPDIWDTSHLFFAASAPAQWCLLQNKSPPLSEFSWRLNQIFLQGFSLFRWLPSTFMSIPRPATGNVDHA